MLPKSAGNWPRSPKSQRVPSDLAISLNNLGLARRWQNKLSEAMAACRESIEIQTARFEEDPENPTLASNLGSTLNNSAMISLAQKDFAKASDDFQRAVKTQKIALDREPNNATYRQNLGKSLANLTQLLRQLKDSDGELEILRQRHRSGRTNPSNSRELPKKWRCLSTKRLTMSMNLSNCSNFVDPRVSGLKVYWNAPRFSRFPKT